MNKPLTIYDVQADQFGMKQVAELAWEYAEEKYKLEALYMPPREKEIQKALMWAQVAKIFDHLAKDRDGFIQAMKNIRTKGKIFP